MSNNKMRKSMLYIIYLGILSKILLFFKDILTASKIGVNYKMDSYLVAFGTIMFLTKIVGDGLIVGTIPVFQEIRTRHGKNKEIEFVNNLLNIICVVSLFLIVIGYMGAPIIIKIFGPGFKERELEKTILLFRMGLPLLMMSWIRAAGAGFLQANHAFRAGAKGGVSSAVVYIIYLLFFAERFGLKGLMITGILAVMSQAYIVVKTMMGIDYRYRWKLDFKDKYLPRAINLLFPILIGIGVNELNNSVDTAIASTLPLGSITELNYANEIINLFLGLFIGAIVTVIFPLLSESHSKRDDESLKKGIAQGITSLFKVSIPVSIILMSMAEPIVKIFFERGAFDAEAAFFTAEALAYYAVGLTAMSMMPFITRIYYSIHDMKTPVIISLIALVVNVIVDLSLISSMGARGVALGTSSSVILASIIGVYDLNRRLKFADRKKIWRNIMRYFAAAAAMAIGIALTYGLVIVSMESVFLNNMVTVGLSSLVGVILYLLVLKVL